MVYKYKVSLCVVIKNEKDYMDEFLEHYIGQGVDQIYIINNNSTDNIEYYIRNHKYSDKITLINDNTDMKYTSNNCSNIHKEILDKNLYHILKEETEWAMIVDMDEFITGKNGYTISSYIDSLNSDVNAVYIYWSIIQPLLDNERNVSESFSIKKSRKRINLDLFDKISGDIVWASKFGKSLFRTCALIEERKFWIHKVPIFGKRITNYNTVSTSWYDNVDDIDFTEENYNKLNIVLNHYAIRDRKDYLKRCETMRTTDNDTKRFYSQALINICSLSDEYLVDDFVI